MAEAAQPSQRPLRRPPPLLLPAKPASTLDNSALDDNVLAATAFPSKRERAEAGSATCVTVGLAVPEPSLLSHKRPRPHSTDSDASHDAVALGYELGTIKHSAYVLLLRAGLGGLTVSSIVDTATREGMYSWGSCKTPNNSVTAALSQDTNFQRVAPSTYALRDTLHPVGQAAAREAAAIRTAAIAAAAERGVTLSAEALSKLGCGNKARSGGGHSSKHHKKSHPRPASHPPRPKLSGAASGLSGPSSSAGGRTSERAAERDMGAGEEMCSPRRVHYSFDFRAAAEVPQPAPASFVYPPNSPPTPEEERLGGARGAAPIWDTPAMNRRLLAGAQPSSPPMAPASPLNHETPCAVRPVCTEAQARAERWRSEACRRAVFDVVAAPNLPSWAVQAYLVEKERSRDSSAATSLQD